MTDDGGFAGRSSDNVETDARAQLIERLRAYGPLTSATQSERRNNYWLSVQRGATFPAWEHVEAFVRAHDGDPLTVLDLWQRARADTKRDQRRSPSTDEYSTTGFDASGRPSERLFPPPPPVQQSHLANPLQSKSARLVLYSAVSLGSFAVPVIASTTRSGFFESLLLVVTGFLLLVGFWSALWMILRFVKAWVGDSVDSIPFDLVTEAAWPFRVERLVGDYWVQLPTELYARWPARLIALLGGLGFVGGGAATINALVQTGAPLLWSGVAWVLGATAMAVGLWMLRERSIVLQAVKSLGDALAGVPALEDDVPSARLERIARKQAVALRRSRDDAAADLLVNWAARQAVR